MSISKTFSKDKTAFRTVKPLGILDFTDWSYLPTDDLGRLYQFLKKNKKFNTGDWYGVSLTFLKSAIKQMGGRLNYPRNKDGIKFPKQ